MRRVLVVRRAVVACLTSVPLWTLAPATIGVPGTAAAQVVEPGPAYVETVPGTLVVFEMVPVPGGTVTVNTPDGPRTMDIAPFWMARTETTWDLYDVFVYNLDRAAPRAEREDAVSRPSRPYVLPGDDFGHEGLPALGMSLHAARQFANWVSVRTGRSYRVPTEAQWLHACRLGSSALEGADAVPIAWTARDSDERTRAVGGKEQDALGLHDMLGNVAEWVSSAASDSVALGGAWDDEAENVGCSARRAQTPAWNETDPQLPKSRWWLTDAPFLGVRLIRIPDDSTETGGNGP